MSASFLCLISLLTASSTQARSRGNWSWYWPRRCSGTDDWPSTPSYILACSTHPRRSSGRPCIFCGYHLLWSSTGFSIPSSGSACHAAPSTLSGYGCAAAVRLPASANWRTDDASCTCSARGLTWCGRYTAASWPGPHGRPDGGRRGRDPPCEAAEDRQDSGHDDLPRGRLAQHPSCKHRLVVSLI